ncbi:imidazoleglycerol-phosphate dehydratase [Limnochorda pilosa]|uniref:Imidazoleglycerol-phosphate dehydratase n=1 Tax=Limnochorda pilosa TaxID=1555112 RepID=A0A0K2SNI0_LIMPI|nr:imidazoleglycerol-phosphate dehydratase HisB [Limnochorda pilosa]BAS28651.1 imidazoleglycerol-phosphate dehydratase [Limnochorda pilosa]
MSGGDFAAGAPGARQARYERSTRETQVRVTLTLDGHGDATVQTGVGFLDHMLESFARHGLFDLAVEARGDLQVDAHHTVEDVGLCLGEAFRRALGEGRGVRRFGEATVPMDEALVRASVDLSGRPYLVCRLQLAGPRLGTMDVQLVSEFFRALATRGALTLHVHQLEGENDHHVVEAAFKAVARALDQATALDPRVQGVPSTKGRLLDEASAPGPTGSPAAPPGEVPRP